MITILLPPKRGAARWYQICAALADLLPKRDDSPTYCYPKHVTITIVNNDGEWAIHHTDGLQETT